MKPIRTLRTAPRTLAAAPPPQLRAPQGASRVTAFPALAVALAGGVILPACESPQCGGTRSDELERHGREGTRALSAGRASDALTEIGLALGVVRHRSTTWGRTAGAVRPVESVPLAVPPAVPPAVPQPPVHIAGGPMRVLPQVAQPQQLPASTTPEPPTVAPHRPVRPPPAAHPPQAHPRTGGAPPRATPLPPSSSRGGLARASSLPVDLHKL